MLDKLPAWESSHGSRTIAVRRVRIVSTNSYDSYYEKIMKNLPPRSLDWMNKRITSLSSKMFNLLDSSGRCSISLLFQVYYFHIFARNKTRVEAHSNSPLIILIWVQNKSEDQCPALYAIAKNNRAMPLKVRAVIPLKSSCHIIARSRFIHSLKL